MGGMSPIHWIILAAVVLVLFGGGGKISGLMGDFAKGIKSFKKSMADEEGAGKTPETPAGHIEAPRPSVTAQSTQQDARMAEDETRGRNS